MSHVSGPPEQRREDAHQRQHGDGVPPCHRGPAVPSDLRPYDPRRHGHLAGDHDDASRHEQRPVAVPVHRDNGHDRGAHIDHAY
jgi:hypothetical protein